MENAPDKLNATPQPPSARVSWWKSLFAKKVAEEEVPCWSCQAIRNIGSSKPWDIDCRFCDSPNQKSLEDQGCLVDLDKVLDAFGYRFLCYRLAFYLLVMVTRGGKTERIVFKADFKNGEVENYIFESGKSNSISSVPFSLWPDLIKALEGILWFGKRPFVRLMKNGQIFQAKMSRWPKGHRETVVIDVAPEK